MDFRVGPSFRTYTIIQAVLIAGLVGFLTRSVNPTRAILVVALIAVISFAISGLTWSRKNRIPSTAAYVLGITAELGVSIPFANHPNVIRVTGQLLGPMSAFDVALLAAVTLIFLSCFTAWLGAFVHSMVKDLPQGWHTPLWGGPDRQKVVLLRRAS